MRNAIATEFPIARHRWCNWPVVKKAKESLGPVYSKNCTFRARFHKLLSDHTSTAEFEQRWAELIAEFGLADNEFLSRVYEHRAMWAKPYFADTFCAGMTSTQRSESANHMLKTYIPRAAPMHLSVSQYTRLVADREADEGREDHATKQVLVQMGAKEIPPCLVLKRWTMEAKSSRGSGNGSVAHHSAPDLASLHSILYSAAMELVTLGRSSRQAFEVALNFVCKGKAAIGSMTVIPRAGTTGEEFEDQDSVQVDGSGVTGCEFQGVSAPPRVRSRGRPAQSRLKSPIESPGSRKRKNSGENQGTGGQAPSSIRTRSKCSFVQSVSSDSVMVGVESPTAPSVPDDLVSRSGKRTCQLCGEKGHYRSTCGRKSSYKAK
ncbi:unnamed protein product [Urochloa humidicola]